MGFPWALAGAVLLLVGFELFLHGRSRMGLIAYASDEGQYHAVRDIVEAVGPAEVALVGSSQVREGVAMPTFVGQLERRLGRPVTAANYAVRGARPDVMDAIVRLLQRQPTPPRMVVVGIAPRDLRADEVDWPRAALFWDWADWHRAYRRYGRAALGVLPVLIRNDVGRVLWTLKYREQMAVWATRPLVPLGVDTGEEGNPILGQQTWQNTGWRATRSLADTNKAQFDKNFERAKETYLLGDTAKPRPAMRTSLIDLTDALAAGPFRSLFVEMPVADVLRAELVEAGLTRAFVQAVRQASAGRVPFVPAAEQAFRPSSEEFADLQHLNRAGAERYAIWLAGEVAGRLEAGSTKRTD